MKKLVKIENMKCEGCAKTVTNKFSEVDGVSRVIIDLKEKVAHVETATELTKQQLNATLADTKFEVTAITEEK
ncbi:heavy-metal-associated domain-containing protein [Lacticigenium naphthae]|uniref:heavy-metal-associated domain-containing protein n=1 Tax=Lacticigenium naphthae TaxID=515351 RepID=UPI0003F67283|nr:heavy metal-associated domain-containing protein [Lacticigenium naphthae]